MNAKSIEEITEALAAPFEPSEVKWRAGATKGNRALALPYVDARVVQDRLDDVLGVAGWQDDLEPLAGGCVLCRLRCKIGEEWICKQDVGGASEQPDEGDRTKAAFSDALKRAAVKFGIGRYLYRLPHIWVDYDPQKKQLVKVPTLPASALPRARGGPAPGESGRPAGPAAEARGEAGNANGNGVVTGKALLERLLAKEEALVKEHVINPGELMQAVRAYVQAQAPALRGTVESWPEEGYHLAAAAVKAFEKRARKRAEAAPA